MVDEPAVRRAAVLGRPIAHSLSPALHRAAYRWLGLRWSYEAIDLAADELGAFLDGLDDDWVGLSLTMPLKESVVPLLNAIDPLARTLRSVNTVLLTPAGRVGHNTDVPGLVSVLGEHGVLNPRTATVLGAGATARSAVAALVAVGAERVAVCARRPESMPELEQWVQQVASASVGAARSANGRVGPAVSMHPWDEAGGRLDAEVVVSTVPAGAVDHLVDRLVGRGESLGLLVDVVYDPSPTLLGAAWMSAGGPVAGGLEMLVHQALGQVTLMTGHEVPVSVLRGAGLAELEARSHADGGRSRGAAGPPKQ